MPRRPSLAAFTRSRLGAGAASALLVRMLKRAFTAPSLRRFWYYWNPAYGYVLQYFCYRPLSRLLPASVALVITFAASGLLLHDLLVFLVMRMLGGSAYFPVVTLAFVFVALAVLASEQAGWSLRRLSDGQRRIVHSAVLLSCFTLSIVVGTFAPRPAPNPSIERTAKSQLRWLSPAAHVER